MACGSPHWRPFSDPSHLPQALASALDVHAHSKQPIIEILSLFLQSKNILIVIDNCEHLVPECGNQPGNSKRFDAVLLYVERARAVLPHFCLAEENALSVAEICIRLDGLPLAIELAAARVKILPPLELAKQMDHRLSFVIGTGRDLPARQRTLRDGIGWSYGLLDEEEKGLFTRLSVFVAGCDYAGTWLALIWRSSHKSLMMGVRLSACNFPVGRSNIKSSAYDAGCILLPTRIVMLLWFRRRWQNSCTGRHTSAGFGHWATTI